MSTELTVALATGLLALITAGIGALINSWITARAGIDENLRDRRLEVYPKLWDGTGATPRWPRTEPNRRDLTELHKTYRAWYFCTGGIFLSESARARYGDVQELLAALDQVLHLVRQCQHPRHNLARALLHTPRAPEQGQTGKRYSIKVEEPVSP